MSELKNVSRRGDKKGNKTLKKAATTSNDKIVWWSASVMMMITPFAAVRATRVDEEVITSHRWAGSKSHTASRRQAQWKIFVLVISRFVRCEDGIFQLRGGRGRNLLEAWRRDYLRGNFAFKFQSARVAAATSTNRVYFRKIIISIEIYIHNGASAIKTHDTGMRSFTTPHYQS